MDVPRIKIPILALLAFVIVFSISGCAQRHPAPELKSTTDVTIRYDIPYAPADPKDALRNSLDIYLPASGANWPTLVLVHGGAWTIGGKRLVGNVAYALAQNGVAVAAVNYRLSPKVKHPVHAEDVARAVDWTVRNLKKFGADTDTLFLAGHSAGGHLVSLLGLDAKYLAKYGIDNRRLAGVISISGVYEIDDEIFKPIFGEDPKVWREASPQTWIAADSPPFLVLYAEHDMNWHVPLARQAVEFQRALHEAGADARIVEIPGANHDTIVRQVGQGRSRTLDAMLEFIRANSA